MTLCSILVLAFIAADDPPNRDPREDRARRAAIVDRIMAEPPRSDLRLRKIEAPEPGAREAQGKNLDENPFAAGIIEGRIIPKPQVAAPRPQVFDVVIAQPQRRITLETPEQTASLDGDDVDEPPLPPPPVPRVLNLNNAVLGRENFDRWVFGEGVDEETRRDHLNVKLKLKIDFVVKKDGFTAPQIQKLQLAGRGDIKRLLDRVEIKRQEFESVRKNFQTGRLFLTRLDPIFRDYQNGPFGNDSLFAKTLRKMESDRKEGR